MHPEQNSSWSLSTKILSININKNKCFLSSKSAY